MHNIQFKYHFITPILKLNNFVNIDIHFRKPGFE